jgi:hypothetical protein
VEEEEEVEPEEEEEEKPEKKKKKKKKKKDSRRQVDAEPEALAAPSATPTTGTTLAEDSEQVQACRQLWVKWATQQQSAPTLLLDDPSAMPNLETLYFICRHTDDVIHSLEVQVKSMTELLGSVFQKLDIESAIQTQVALALPKPGKLYPFMECDPVKGAFLKLKRAVLAECIALFVMSQPKVTTRLTNLLGDRLSPSIELLLSTFALLCFHRFSK